ncbi:hypothetical protein ACHAWC_010246 [Mediolabrus comicus]
MAQETNSPSPSATKATSSETPTFLSASIIEVPTPSPTVPATAVAPPPTISSEAPITPTVSPSAIVTTASPIASTLAPTVVIVTTNSPTISPTTNSPTSLSPSVKSSTGTPTTTGSNGTTTGSPTTLQPSSSGSNISTTGAPTTGTPTVVLTTGTPTSQPTGDAIDATPAPTTVTTIAPTTISPTANPTTTEAISSSSPAPTKATTTQSPSKSKPESSSSKPTIYMKPTSTTGLQMTLTGIERISDPSSWATTTSTFFASQYEDTGYMSNVKVEIVYSDEKVVQQGERRIMRKRRGLQTNNGSVQVTYEQYTSYTSTNASLTLDDVLRLPLMDGTQQDQYIAALKQLSNDYGSLTAQDQYIAALKQLSNDYGSLTAVSTISLASDDGGNGNGGGGNPNNPDGSGGSSFPLWAIIVIAVGGGLILIVCLVPILYRNCCRGDASLESIHEQSSSRPFNTTGEETVGTTDYDYSKAYGAVSSNFSLSDAGGTIGSRTRQTASDPLPQSSENNTIFSDDPTYNDPVYEGGGGREEILDVYAPAGKLGVVIDTPNDGAPIVHAVKDSSPIADKIQVGDKLVAVDDQDVRTMTAIQVSKLISKKSVNASRKMTVIRHIAD